MSLYRYLWTAIRGNIILYTGHLIARYRTIVFSERRGEIFHTFQMGHKYLLIIIAIIATLYAQLFILTLYKVNNIHIDI